MGDKKVFTADGIPLRTSFVVLWQLLEADEPLSSSLTRVFSNHVSKFASPSSAFSPPSDSSRKKLKSKSVQVADKNVKVDETEVELVIQVSDWLQLDEIETMVLLREVMQKGEVYKEGSRISADLQERVLIAWAEERLGLMLIIQNIIRHDLLNMVWNGETADDSQSELNEWADSIIGDFLVPATYPYTILQWFVALTRQLPPPTMLQSSRYSAFFARQMVKEQKATLEIFFLAFYSRFIPDAQITIAFLGVLKETAWGKRQEAFGHFDEETHTLNSEIESLLTLIGTELLDLEKWIFGELDRTLVSAPEKAMPNTSDVVHPDNLQQITALMLDLENVDAKRASVIWLGWAYLLSTITEKLRTAGIRSEYKEFALQILPLSDFTTEEIDEFYRTRSSLPNPQTPAFELLTARALLPGPGAAGFCGAVHEILTSTLLSPVTHVSYFHSLSRRDLSLSAGPNALGYLSVLKSVISTIPLLLRLPSLPPNVWDALIDNLTLLYSSAGSAPLRAQFWRIWSRRMYTLYTSSSFDDTMDDVGRSVASHGEIEILDLAASRFPVQTSPFLKVLTALCTPFRSGDQNMDILFVEGEVTPSDGQLVYGFLRSGLTSLMMLIPTQPGSFVPLPYLILPDERDEDGAGTRVRCEREIFVSKNLLIPVGTEGFIVNRNPVVIRWEFRWNAWMLFKDLVDMHAHPTNRRRGVEDNPFAVSIGDERPLGWSEEECADHLIAFLDILNAILKNEPALGYQLFRDAEANNDIIVKPDFLLTLFEVLHCALTEDIHIPLPTTHELLLGFLHTASNEVWAFIRQNVSMIFPISTLYSKMSKDSSSSTFRNERLSGSYPVTLSLLALVQGLILDGIKTLYITQADYSDVKRDVLAAAIKWTRDEVWSSYLGWKYLDVSQKHEIGFRVLTIFRVLAQEAAMLSGRQPSVRDYIQGTSQFILDSFLWNATLATLEPLLWIVGNGSSNIASLRQRGGTSAQVEVERLQTTIKDALELLRELLIVRKLKGRDHAPSLLEKILFGSLSNNSQREPMKALFNYIISPHTTSIAKLATRSLTYLTVLSADWEAPSLLSLLGTLDDTEKLLPSIYNILEEDSTDSEYRAALWDLISSIVDHQSALGILFVTGRNIPLARPLTEEEKKHRTAVTIAFKMLNQWETLYGVKKNKTQLKVDTEDEEEDPSVVLVLASALRFLRTTWQHAREFGQTLMQYRDDPAIWDKLMHISSANVGTVPDTGDWNQKDPDLVDEINADITKVCYRLTAKLCALEIVTIDVQMSSRPTATKGKVIVQPQQSLDNLLNFLSDARHLRTAISGAVSSHCEPELHHRIRAVLENAVPSFKLEDCRRPVGYLPDGERRFGEDYLYDHALATRKLSGFVHKDSSFGEKDVERLEEVIKLTNNNWSITDCEVAFCRAWTRLLEGSVQLFSANPKVIKSIFNVLDSIFDLVSSEERYGDIMVQVQSERLNLLLWLVEVASKVNLQDADSSTRLTLTNIIKGTVQIVTNRALPVRESVTRQMKIHFHQTVFRIQYYTVKLVSSVTGWSDQDIASLAHSFETLVRAHTIFLGDIMLLATQVIEQEVRSDLSYAVALFQRLVLLSTSTQPFRLRPSYWFAQFYETGIVSKGLQTLDQMSVMDHKPFYVPHILDLFIGISSLPNGPEYLALEGLMSHLCNNALTMEAESGSISIKDSRFPGERNPLHRLWCQIVILAGTMVKALGSSPMFMENDLFAFLQLYRLQIQSSLSYKVAEQLSIGQVECLVVSTELIYQCLCFGRGHQVHEMAKVVSLPLLHLLQQINYLLNHPNQLLGLLDAMDEEEAWLLEKESRQQTLGEKWFVEKGNDVLKSIVASLVTVVDLILLSLIRIGDTMTILSHDEVDWPDNKIVILPTNKVSLDEPASVGTLFDLLDILIPSFRVSSMIEISNLPLLPPPLTPLSASEHKQKVRRILESTLTLLAAQLALVLQSKVSGWERIKRDVKMQMASDLMTCIKRAEGEEGVDKELMRLLKRWTEGRLMG